MANDQALMDLSYDELAYLCKYMSAIDILNFSVTCKQLYMLLDNNSLWKSKFFERWPSLKETYVEYLEEDIVMKEEVIKGLKCEKALLSCLSLMPYTDEVPLQPRHCCEMDVFNPLFYFEEDICPLTYYYFHNKLIEIIKCNPRNKQTNLTHMHYADKFSKHMLKYYVKDKWQALMDLVADKRIIEQAASIVAQWFQPHKYIFYSHISKSLDDIVQHILKTLKDQYPSHSIFTICARNFLYWKNNNIADNQWNELEAKQILDVLITVIFHELQFEECHGDLEHRHTDPRIFLIDQVLERKKGSPLCLIIIIQALTRRLGICCEIMLIGSHFCLSWINSYKVDFKDKNYYLIDVYGKGSITKAEREYYYNIYSMVVDISVLVKESVLDVIKVMSQIYESLDYVLSEDRNDGQSSHELTDMVFAYLNKIEKADMLKYIQTSPNIEEDADIDSETDIISTMNILKNRIESVSHSPYINIRRNNPKYVVGMLVEYKELGFLYGMGVIIGWNYPDNIYCDPKNRKIKKQPFYYILGCNNNKAHVAERHLTPMDTPHWISHSDIGQYFNYFHKTHYVSNQVHRQYFPEDAILLERYVNLNNSKKIRDDNETS